MAGVLAYLTPSDITSLGKLCILSLMWSVVSAVEDGVAGVVERRRRERREVAGEGRARAVWRARIMVGTVGGARRRRRRGIIEGWGTMYRNVRAT